LGEGWRNKENNVMDAKTMLDSKTRGGEKRHLTATGKHKTMQTRGNISYKTANSNLPGVRSPGVERSANDQTPPWRSRSPSSGPHRDKGHSTNHRDAKEQLL